jgi:hypothetical protein
MWGPYLLQSRTPASRSFRLVLATIVFLGSALAGCIGPTESPESWRAFRATYTDSGSNQLALNVELRGSEVITGRDGERRPVYPVKVDYRKGGELQMQRTFFVDGAYRIAREDSCFNYYDHDCENLEVSWRTHGQIAPLGLGLHHGPDVFDQYVHYEPVALRFEKTSVSEGFELALLNPVSAGEPFVPIGGAFDGGSMTVVRTPVDENGVIWRRDTYQDLGPLPSVPAWPQDRPEGSTMGWTYFGGENRDPFAIGYTYKQIFEKFRSSVPLAQEWLRTGGCFIQFYFSVPPDDGAIDQYLYGNGWVFTWSLADPDGAIWSFEGSLRRNLFGDEWQFDQEPTSDKMSRECADGSKRASLTLEGAIQKAERLSGFPPLTVQIIFAHVENQDVQFGYHFRPGGRAPGLTLMNNILFDSDTGEFVRANLPLESRGWL